jgi:glycine dehydrogenase
MKTDAFALRHIGTGEKDLNHMLKTIGVDSVDQLIYETIPTDIRLKNELNLEKPMTEYEYLNHIQELGKKNKVFKSYIGLGYNPAIVPAVIQRNIFENPGWYTAYTPYQAEIAQGRLEAILNYQTTVIELTGMEIANASLLDEGTAAAEAMTLLFDVRTRDQKKNNVSKFFVSEEILPQTLSVLQTRSTPLNIELVVGNHETFDFSSDFFGAILQYPGKFGQVHDYTAFIAKATENEIKVAVAADILSLVKLKSPGEMGAAVVVGTSQRFGIPMGYGGPHAAFFATKDEYKRSMPGRIIGVSIDVNGNRALRMALGTREQHIKREKATSNICTAQVLLAVMAGMYAVYHGPKGLKYIANKVHNSANTTVEALNKIGVYQTNTSYFDTINVKADAAKVKAIAEKNEVNFFYIDADTISISFNETTSISDINQIVAIFAEAKEKTFEPITELVETTVISENLIRKSTFLQHDVFNNNHSESQLMRYIKKLERKDLALNHSMISLGSCTMKLNAAAEMLPLSMGNWNNIHPFAPLDQVEGYLTMLNKLEQQLNEVTGFTGTTLQPNSGAQGEYAGLMTIRAYHLSRGDKHRTVCLIPSSAHGTNPASAAMAGMDIIVTKTTPEGNIDVEDLREKAILHSANLAASHLFFPISLHGVFESSIIEITNLIHENGGLVYMDGANMNAQVGLTNPATIGADVCHLNLHKTFAIPHGGGGPGVGLICVNDKLVPFLPSNPIVKVGGDQAITAISAAPYGSALVCLISYGYICMLGAEGLTNATKHAILNANYMKARLESHYPILYSGEMGRAAHEMILDCRAFEDNGIKVTDIAKRLMDYGFHAPTVSFPVAGTLMIEPTESEDLAELDRFCDAMIAIRKEINASSKDDTQNILKNAPHTLAMVTSDEWVFPYTREVAAFPLEYIAENKFWPTVRRVDEAYGDRNLVCSCAPIEAYM